MLNMYQPAAYVPDAPCVRPFRKRGLASAEHVSPAAYAQDASCARPFRKERVSQVLNMSEDLQSTPKTPHAFAFSVQNIA